ncbi:MAG: hypothetical protein WCK49_06080 [Myxococcaceae bacterium]
MKPLFLFLYFSCLSVGAIAGFERPCLLPLGRVYLVSDSQKLFTPPALPVIVTEVTKTGASVATAVSLFTAVGPTQVAQNSRSALTLDILACDENSPTAEGQLDWPDNPTRLSIGDGLTQYDMGAVVGNWVLVVSVAGVLMGLSKKLSLEQAHFPGTMILPVMFLITPTTTSAMTLLREGSAAGKAVGAISIAASLLGTGIVGVLFHPKYFKAHWDLENEEWIDLREDTTGYVDRHGFLFESYGPGRQWYVVFELLTSMAIGGLKSYQVLEQHCGTILWVGAGIYNTYALSQLAFRPNKNRHVQLFYTTIAGLQGVALAAQAIASQTGSNETQQKVRTVTQSIIAGTDFLMMIKTLFDIGLRVKDLYERFYHPRAMHKPFAHNRQDMQEMLVVPQREDDQLSLADTLSEHFSIGLPDVEEPVLPVIELLPELTEPIVPVEPVAEVIPDLTELVQEMTPAITELLEPESLQKLKKPKKVKLSDLAQTMEDAVAAFRELEAKNADL